MRTFVAPVVTLLAFIVLAPVPNNVASESLSLPCLLDLGQLRFYVLKTEVVDEISGAKGGEIGTTSASPGYKLVVVTMKGETLSPCVFVANTSKFATTWEALKPSEAKGKKEVIPEIITSFAVDVDKSWFISTEKSRWTRIFRYQKPGPVVFKIAFMLPEGVDRFFICYPTLAQGKATIPMPGGEEPQ